jgi:hypothetical protein
MLGSCAGSTAQAAASWAADPCLHLQRTAGGPQEVVLGPCVKSQLSLLVILSYGQQAHGQLPSSCDSSKRCDRVLQERRRNGPGRRGSGEESDLSEEQGESGMLAAAVLLAHGTCHGTCQLQQQTHLLAAAAGPVHAPKDGHQHGSCLPACLTPGSLLPCCLCRCCQLGALTGGCWLQRVCRGRPGVRGSRLG